MALKEKQRKNRTEESVKNPNVNARKIADTYPLRMNVFLCMAFGFLLSMTNVGGSGAPVAAAFMAALNPFQGFSAFVGSVIFYIYKGTVARHITEIVAMTLLLIVKTLSNPFRTSKTPVSSAKGSVTAGFVYLLSGLVCGAFFTLTLPIAFAVALRATLCFIIAYFIFEFCLDIKAGVMDLSGEKSISAAVVYTLFICTAISLSVSLDVNFLNLGQVLGAFAILVLSHKNGVAGGAVTGALTALGIILASNELSVGGVLLICSGLLAGVFCNRGKLAVAVVFIAAVFIGETLTGMRIGSFNMLFDVSIAAVLFVATPDRITTKLVKTSSREGTDGPAEQKLSFAAYAINDVKENVLSAAKTLRDNEHSVTRKGDNILHTASDCLTATQDALTSMKSSSDFPSCDRGKSLAIRKIMRSLKLREITANVFYDKDGHTFIECYFENEISDVNYLIRKIESVIDMQTDEPHILEFNGVTRLCLHEIPPLAVDVGTASKSANCTYDPLQNYSENYQQNQSQNHSDNELSGDSENWFSNGLGNVFFILSDGMGTGNRAAVESRMNVSILTKLLKAGIEPESCVKLTAVLMNAKSADEVFSTVDLTVVNLFSGKTDIIKSGAPATFIKSKNIIRTYEPRTFPTGIFASADYDKKTFEVSNGDMLIMLTDGVGENCFPKVKELMLSRGVTAQYVADEILDYAVKNELAHPDDKTVMVLKINS